MKFPFVVFALCVTLVAGFSGCGGDEATSSDAQDSSAAAAADGGGNAKTAAKPLVAKPSKVVIGDYEEEGPFAAISGGEGNEKPHFEPSGQPASDKTIARELKVGSGPAAKHGDEVSIYYAGADQATGKIQYYGWPPFRPATFRLGFSAFGRSWEKTIEGMKVGGIREVIITAGYLSKTPLDYVIVLTALQPASGDS